MGILVSERRTVKCERMRQGECDPSGHRVAWHLQIIATRTRRRGLHISICLQVGLAALVLASSSRAAMRKGFVILGLVRLL